MDQFDYYHLETQADKLGEKIVKRYKSYGVHLEIKDTTIFNDRFSFKVKHRPGTRVDDITKYEKDVRLALKLVLLQIIHEDHALYIVASKAISFHNHLFQLLSSCEYQEAKKMMEIAHPIGFDAVGRPVIEDLANSKNAIFAGTTGSGKSMALISLLVSLVCEYSPREVNLLIGDRVGDLCVFNGIPHLSYKIIEKPEIFLKILIILKGEMERRIRLKHNNSFSRLPALVFAIDEFHAFIDGLGNKADKLLAAKTLSDILRRARHAKIHIILVAHNPTQQKMLIDLSDIPTRMAFRCAKFNNSVTVLGESGAEKLIGAGDMLYKSPTHDELQRIKGVYISPVEVKTVLEKVRYAYNNRPLMDQNRGFIPSVKTGFIITENDLETVSECGSEDIAYRPATVMQDMDNELFIRIIMWSLGRDSISCNLICDTFFIGWRRANGFLSRLHLMGIVGDLYVKLPRVILPKSIEDMPPDVMALLSKNSIEREEIEACFRRDDSIR